MISRHCYIEKIVITNPDALARRMQGVGVRNLLDDNKL